MTPRAALQLLHTLGGSLSLLPDGQLSVRLPSAIVPLALAAALKAHEAEVVAFVRGFTCRGCARHVWPLSRRGNCPACATAAPRRAALTSVGGIR